jgi:hypothetical protein
VPAVAGGMHITISSPGSRLVTHERPPRQFEKSDISDRNRRLTRPTAARCRQPAPRHLKWSGRHAPQVQRLGAVGHNLVTAATRETADELGDVCCVSPCQRPRLSITRVQLNFPIAAIGGRPPCNRKGRWSQSALKLSRLSPDRCGITRIICLSYDWSHAAGAPFGT